MCGVETGLPYVDAHPKSWVLRTISFAYLDSEEETKLYILVFLDFGPDFGQSWARERAQRPRLEKCYINQRKLARETESKTPKLKSKIRP